MLKAILLKKPPKLTMKRNSVSKTLPLQLSGRVFESPWMCVYEYVVLSDKILKILKKNTQTTQD